MLTAIESPECSNVEDHVIEDSGVMFGVHLLADQEPEIPDALFRREEDAWAWLKYLKEDPEHGGGCDPQVIRTTTVVRWSNCLEHPEPPTP